MMIRIAIATLASAGLALGLAPVASAGPPYASCKAAAADGAYNMQKGDPGYSTKLDRDGDGIACERK